MTMISSIINDEISETTTQSSVDKLNTIILVTCGSKLVLRHIGSDLRDRALFASDETNTEAVYADYIDKTKQKFV